MAYARDIIFTDTCLCVLQGSQGEYWLFQSVCTVYNLLDEDSTVLFCNSTINLFNQKFIHFTVMGSDAGVIIARYCGKETYANVTNTNIH